MIRVENLRKVFDNEYEALKSVSFNVKQGELVCLLGPSGCGKTTVLNLIAGLLAPTSGDIYLNGRSVVGVEPKDRNIGYVFQNYALYPHMTVRENVMFPLTVGKNKPSKEEANAITDHYLELTNLTEYQKQKPAKLSGGQQQRVAIARALVQKPDVLLLDEPLSNLDARLRLTIREEIRRLVKEVGITTIFVTHDQEEALSISDQIVLLDEGVIQQDAKPQELYLEPSNKFSATFIGSPVINQLDFTYSNGELDFEGLKIPVDNLSKDRFKKDLIEGESYTYAIRPENVLVSPVNLDKPHIKLNGLVTITELVGRDQIVHLEVEGEKLRALTNIEQLVKEHETIDIALLNEKAYIFDSSGERVY